MSNAPRADGPTASGAPDAARSNQGTDGAERSITKSASRATHVALAVGARYACFFCRTREQRPGRCERCGRTRFELKGESANSRLVQLARRVFKATAVHGSKPERERALTVVAHVIAVATSFMSVWIAHHYSSSFSGPTLVLFALAAVLGYVGGYLSVALFLLLLLLTTAAVALAATVGILAVVAMIAPLTLLVPQPRGDALRARIGSLTERAIALVFEPVFRLRGAGPVARWKKPRRHEGLRPVRLALPAPARPAVRFEGTLGRCPEEVSIANVRAAIVGVAGYTIGARVEDAIVAPFELETVEGPVRVEVAVGEVVFAASATSGQRETVSRDLPTQWGVAHARRRPEAMPPNEAVAVFAARKGARVRVEGGELTERAAVTDQEGYRTSSFERSLKGTEEHPVRITIL
ncbi:MAG: hypothetical protein JNK05_15390 [Myxococcales bacterium]|nr:hypothetical protein [Myxococcales bacterium]